MPRKAVAKMQTSASAGLRQPVSPDLAMHAPSASSSAAYQRLSENGQLYAWLIFGGMIWEVSSSVSSRDISVLL
jgi:hypothetical protein